MRRLTRSLAQAGLVALVTLVAAGVAGATNDQTYTDATGDNNGAPDITTVRVSNDTAGNLNFQITLAGAPELGAATFLVAVDSDQDPSTGVGGGEYDVFLGQGALLLCRLSGGGCDSSIPQPVSATYSYVYGVLSFTVASALVGVTSGFNFAVGSVAADPSVGTGDPAPDAGFWNYQVVTAPPRLVLRRLALIPRKPEAGKSLSVSMTLRRGDSGAPVTSGKVGCRARIGAGGSVKGIGGFVESAAICLFKIPKTAKGKTIRGAITVAFEGATLSKPFSAKIK